MYFPSLVSIIISILMITIGLTVLHLLNQAHFNFMWCFMQCHILDIFVWSEFRLIYKAWIQTTTEISLQFHWPADVWKYMKTNICIFVLIRAWPIYWLAVLLDECIMSSTSSLPGQTQKFCMNELANKNCNTESFFCHGNCQISYQHIPVAVRVLLYCRQDLLYIWQHGGTDGCSLYDVWILIQTHCILQKQAGGCS